jgi:hypothetical protein
VLVVLVLVLVVLPFSRILMPLNFLPHSTVVLLHPETGQRQLMKMVYPLFPLLLMLMSMLLQRR